MAESDKSAIVSTTTDFSSDSTVSDDWQELTKSDYAKVIFSDLLFNVASGIVECKFQITDNVHEDPNDYVGLFRIGYDDLSQCLVSKMLSQTKCEDDGKLQRCVFTANELPRLTDGFYQFLYVTRDQEVCGASMPFQIKLSPLPLKESSVDSSASESMDGGFLLVSSETDRKVKEEPNDLEKVSVQRSMLSEQKKEEIATWVSQNPDYYSLIEQISENTFTIDALQQSKDLAMKEVAKLYEHIDRKNKEVLNLQNIVGAYEEKIKMNEIFLDEKHDEMVYLRKMLACCKDTEEEKNVAITNLRKSVTIYEEKVKTFELIQTEKEKELKQLKNELHLQEEKLKANLSLQEQQQTEINELKKELETLKEMQKVKKRRQVTAKEGRHSMECLIQRAQDMMVNVNNTLEDIDYSEEDTLEKFYQLKIQFLIIVSKLQKATQRVNSNDQRLKSPNATNVQRDMHRISHATCPACELVDQDPVETIVENTPKVEISDVATSSVETQTLPDSSDKEPTNGDALEEAVQNPCKAFESEHQINKLPRLDVINEDTAKTLQALKPLDAEDIAVINRLTEKIIKRGANLYEMIELVDDCASDAESDVSEISECTSSMKKDTLCVSRVMDALSSYLSSQTSLNHLIVVEEGTSEDKYHELLQKCALRYQFELLLEHIEKQKEGIKKLSEKICDLLAKYMLLKDEVDEKKAVCEKLECVIDKTGERILSLEKELEYKNVLLGHFRSHSEDLESKAKLTEGIVGDYRARIAEASDLYRKQYIEIQKLSKTLKKYKSIKDKTKSSNAESSLQSSESSKTSASFEVIKESSVQNINDSDTGEHMFEKSSSFSKETPSSVKTSLCEEIQCNANAPTETNQPKDKEIQVQINPNTETVYCTVPETSIRSSATSFDDVQLFNLELKSEESNSQTADDKPNIECNSNPTASVFSDFASYEQFQDAIKESFANIKGSTTSRNSQECFISCYICKQIIPLGPEAPVDLMNHLENEHSMKTCPMCGQLFEDAVPPKYFHIHIEQHFETQ